MEKEYGLVARLPEDDHDRVADQLVHLAAEPLHEGHERPEVGVQHPVDDGGRRSLGEGREALEVGIMASLQARPPARTVRA